MKTIIQLSLVLAVLVSVQSLSNLKPNQPLPKPQGGRQYVNIGGEEFFFYSDFHVNWHDAKFFCEDMSMQLLTMDTEERWLKIFNFLNNNPNFSPFEWYWFSGYKAEGSDQWTWANSGANFTFAAWGTNEPSLGADTEGCTSFSHGTNAWDDDICGFYTLSYICEHPQ